MLDFRAKMHQKSISAYSAPPDPLTGFGGPTSKGRGGKGRGRVKREGEDFEIHEIWRIYSQENH